MESRKDIYHLWVQYTTKNNEEFFRQFIRGFVSVWESQLNLDWVHFPGWQVIKPDSGPHCSRLPEELLPAISKFTYIARDNADLGQLTNEKLEDARLLLRCLLVLCRHMDNIPLVASCDFVGQCSAIASVLIKQLANKTYPELCETSTNYVLSFCHFMECLYDPYFSWRHFIKGDPPDFTTLTYQPSLLHVEVVPFLYDCFETKLIQTNPAISQELLHVLGAIISGAQSTLMHLSPLLERRASKTDPGTFYEGHNALRAVCPATVNVTMGVITAVEVDAGVWDTSLDCFVMMVRILSKSAAAERQIEVAALIQQFKQACLVVAAAGQPPQRMLAALTKLLTSMRLFLVDSQTTQAIKDVLVECHVMDTITLLLDSSLKIDIDHSIISSQCVITMATIMKDSESAKESARRSGVFEEFLGFVRNANPSREVLRSVLSLVCERPYEECMDAEAIRIENPDPLRHLVAWLPSLQDDDQIWLANSLNHICSANICCKTVACKEEMVIKICDVLVKPKSLKIHAAYILISLVQNIALYSVTSFELKYLFQLLREDGDRKVRFRSHLVRALSAISRRNYLEECYAFYDIESPHQGISVPGISKWAGAANGFTFMTWLRLSRSHTPDTQRRQLLNIASSSGAGMQIFFRGDGTVVIGVTTKKEFLTASAAEKPIMDGRWHQLAVAFSAARRHFGHNQITIFIDGSQVLSVSMKFPPFSDPLVVCTVGTVAQQPVIGTESPSSPSIVSTSRLNIMNFVPSHFTLPLRGSNVLDPHVKSFPVGMQDAVWGPSTCLQGHLGLVVMFQDALTPPQIKGLHVSGPNSRSLFSMEENATSSDLLQKLVFCFSPLATWDKTCLDLAPGGKFPGYVTADLIRTHSMRDSMNGVGGLAVLLPLLEQTSRYESGPDLGHMGMQTSMDISDWEGLPRSAFSDHILEQNPVSAFLILLKNLVVYYDHETVVKEDLFGAAGYLLSRSEPQLLDVNFLMGVQVLMDAVKGSPQSPLLRTVHQHLLFNFKIWSQCQFPIRLAHVQYISTIIKEDFKSLRKRYGIQFLLDTIRRYYTGVELLSNEDSKAIRQALLQIVRFYIIRETNATQVMAVLKFLFSVKEEPLLLEVLDTLSNHLESRSCRDQIYLLLYEAQGAELLYGLLVHPEFTTDLKHRVIKLLSVLLRSDRVYEMYKGRLRLQDGSIISASAGMAAGLVHMMTQQPVTLEMVAMILNQFLSTDTANSYFGALTFAYSQWQADLEIKLEIAMKLLTTTYMKPGAPQLVAKQSAWQDSVTRLLIKQPIVVKTPTVETVLPDLMSFDEAPVEYDVLANAFEEVAGVVTDNLNSAADNLSSVVASAYSVIKQKTVEVQESLEGMVPRSGLDASYESSGSEDDISITSRSQSVDPEEAEIAVEDDSNIMDDILLKWDALGAEKTGDKEEQLCYLVVSLLFTVMWRGVEGSNLEAWKQRGQVMACINLLGLNNELYVSHLTLKLRILEMAGQAALSDLRVSGQLVTAHAENAAQLMRWVYDLVVVDPHEDLAKKTSAKLLDVVFGLVDTLAVFQESPTDEWADMVKLTLGILLQFSRSNNLELCAMSTAKLHSLLQTRPVRDAAEGGYILNILHNTIISSFTENNQEKYAFLMPVMKTLLEKLAMTANQNPLYLADLPPLAPGPAFFEKFRSFCQSESWTAYIENKVRPLHDQYLADLTKDLTESMNVFWAECYEGCQHAVAKRTREIAESQHRFKKNIMEPLRSKQAEELARFNSVLCQERHQRWQMKRKWRLMKQFLMGPRGAWTKRTGGDYYYYYYHYHVN